VGEGSERLLENKMYKLATWLFTVGMTKKNSQLSPQELQLIEQLRERPKLMERFEAILQISANADGLVKSADEIEGLFIQEMRCALEGSPRFFSASD
jgi:hypothetical protein